MVADTEQLNQEPGTAAWYTGTLGGTGKGRQLVPRRGPQDQQKKTPNREGQQGGAVDLRVRGVRDGDQSQETEDERRLQDTKKG